MKAISFACLVAVLLGAIGSDVGATPWLFQARRDVVSSSVQTAVVGFKESIPLLAGSSGATRFVATVSSEAGSLFIFRAKSDGTLMPVGTYASGDAPADVAKGRLNADLNYDLVAADGGADSVHVFLAVSAASFGEPSSYEVGGLCSSVICRDLSGDRRPDIAVTTDLGGGTVSVLTNSGDGTFAVPPTHYDVGNDPRFVAAAKLVV